MPYYQYPWSELCVACPVVILIMSFSCLSNDARICPLHVRHDRKEWLSHKDTRWLLNRYSITCRNSFHFKSDYQIVLFVSVKL